MFINKGAYVSQIKNNTDLFYCFYNCIQLSRILYGQNNLQRFHTAGEESLHQDRQSDSQKL
jgi:hypothetical protein